MTCEKILCLCFGQFGWLASMSYGRKINGYIYTIGILEVILDFAASIHFIEKLMNLSWPSLTCW